MKTGSQCIFKAESSRFNGTINGEALNQKSCVLACVLYEGSFQSNCESTALIQEY